SLRPRGTDVTGRTARSLRQIRSGRIRGRIVPLCSGCFFAVRTTVGPVTLDDLARDLRCFAAEREWERFHTPKNLAISLAVEVGELLEHVQWGTDEDIAALVRSPDGRRVVAEELADVLIYLVRLA